MHFKWKSVNILSKWIDVMLVLINPCKGFCSFSNFHDSPCHSFAVKKKAHIKHSFGEICGIIIDIIVEAFVSMKSIAVNCTSGVICNLKFYFPFSYYKIIYFEK